MELSPKAISNHRRNIDFYINQFLLSEDAVAAKDGSDMVEEFLGYWFINKAMWASESAIAQYIASFRKLYWFLLERKDITQDHFDELNHIVKEGKSEWVATLKRFDDPDIEDMSEVWGI